MNEREYIIDSMIAIMEIEAAGRKRQVSIEYKRIKNMWMRVSEDGSLRITCSRAVTQRQIREFILSREDWILKTEKTMERKGSQCSYGAGNSEAVWLGKRLPVRYVPSSSDYLEIDESGLTYYLRKDSDEARMKVFYEAASKQILCMVKDRRGEYDQAVCNAYRKPLPRITVKYMTSRWGSCTPAKAHISISVRLIHFPPVCLDYVMAHEYCHMLEANHSSRFWAYVASLMPEYKAIQKLLKQ